MRSSARLPLVPILAALILPIAAGCVALPGAVWTGFSPSAASASSPSSPRSKPKRVAPLTASGAYARMNEIEDGVRIVVDSEHRRLRRATVGADAEARRAALTVSLENLEPVLAQAEARLGTLDSAPEVVRPLLDFRLARTRDARTALREGLTGVRNGHRREFGGWRGRGPRERRAESALRRSLGLTPEAPSLRVASAFDVRGGAFGTEPTTATRRHRVSTPSGSRSPASDASDVFLPSRTEIRREREFFRIASGASRIVRAHNDTVDRLVAELRAGAPTDRIAWLEHFYDLYDDAAAEDERMLAELRALGTPRGEAKAYIEATHRQFEASAAEMRRILSITEDPEEIGARARAYLQSVARQRLTGDVQRAADAVNARMRRISLRGRALASL